MNEELVFNSTRLDVSRSAFDIKRRDMGTGFVGRLNTLRPFEILPGTAYSVNCANLIRFTTPGVPVMDDLFLDVYFYYCSDEMLLRRQSFSPSLNDGNHSFAAIMGAQDGNINLPFPDDDLKIPCISYEMFRHNNDSASIAAARTVALQYSLLDQLGYPIFKRQYSVDEDPMKNFVEVHDFSCLPLLGYIAIWNEDFREPNLQNRYVMALGGEVAIFESDNVFMSLGADLSDNYGDVYGNLSNAFYYDVDDEYSDSQSQYTLTLATPFGVSRFHGLFGSLLPWPQRNSEPVYLPLGEAAPVLTSSSPVVTVPSGGPYPEALTFGKTNGTNMSYSINPILSIGGTDGRVYSDTSRGSNVSDSLFPNNLYADLRNATSASINTIRAAFQTQKWFEALARGGNSDLDEYINSLFGVVGDIDVVSKRPVYLGGKRIPISINQVNNTGADLGETGGFSLTTDNAHYFKWQSKTYGMIYCVFCIRHAEMFADAPQKFLLKRSKFDFYFPQFANLGEEGYSPSLMAFDPDEYGKGDETPIGYQEYGADYRYDFNALSGQFRFLGDNSWHYATLLEAGEFDLKSWLDASFQALDVDRTLKVPGSSAKMQFYYDFLVYGNRYLPMPVASIPGLVDHH